MVCTVRGIATALARLAMTTGPAGHRWDPWLLFRDYCLIRGYCLIKGYCLKAVIRQPTKGRLVALPFAY